MKHPIQPNNCAGCLAALAALALLLPATQAAPVPAELTASDWASIQQQTPPIAQQAYLKASNTGEGDTFGDSVAVSGDTVVVGAYQENSNATSVNGNQNDNSAPLSGAAYVITGLGAGPTLTLLPDGSGGYFIRFTGAPEVSYRLQRAPAVTGPWPGITTNTAPPSGLIEFWDRFPPPSQAFYRVQQM